MATRTTLRSTCCPILIRTANRAASTPIKARSFWHTDGSWRERTGQATMMYSEIVPEVGGETEFADMYSAYEQLPAAMKSQDRRPARFHNLDFSRTRRHGEDPVDGGTEGPRCRRLRIRSFAPIRTPDERRFSSAIMPESIEGMEYERRPCVDRGAQLNDHARRRAFIPTPGARASSWCGTTAARCIAPAGFDEARYKRVMRRCTINGDRPF